MGGLPTAGMLLIDKPAGWTSHDCVAVLRKLFPSGTKVGHTGTLDPLATGLLVALIGPCTKLQARLQGNGLQQVLFNAPGDARGAL